MITSDKQVSFFRLIRASLIGAFLLLAFDVIYGSFISVVICPIWFLVSLVRTIIKRPGWGAGLARLVIPVVTLFIVGGNASLQAKIANANAERVIAACEQFRAATGNYPEQLTELVPRYMSAVPRAKYALTSSDFRYWNMDGNHQLMWTENPPFGRRIYDFENKKWSSLD